MCFSLHSSRVSEKKVLWSTPRASLAQMWIYTRSEQRGITSHVSNAWIWSTPHIKFGVNIVAYKLHLHCLLLTNLSSQVYTFSLLKTYRWNSKYYNFSSSFISAGACRPNWQVGQRTTCKSMLAKKSSSVNHCCKSIFNNVIIKLTIYSFCRLSDYFCFYDLKCWMMVVILVVFKGDLLCFSTFMTYKRCYNDW